MAPQTRPVKRPDRARPTDAAGASLRAGGASDVRTNESGAPPTSLRRERSGSQPLRLLPVAHASAAATPAPRPVVAAPPQTGGATASCRVRALVRGDAVSGHASVTTGVTARCARPARAGARVDGSRGRSGTRAQSSGTERGNRRRRTSRPSTCSSTRPPRTHYGLGGRRLELSRPASARWSATTAALAAIGCHRGEANFAGARGPAQFLPARGRPTASTPMATAFVTSTRRRMPCSGWPTTCAPQARRATGARALFAYNHSTAYVETSSPMGRRVSATRRRRRQPAPVAPAGRQRGWRRCRARRRSSVTRRIVADVVALVRGLRPERHGLLRRRATRRSTVSIRSGSPPTRSGRTATGTARCGWRPTSAGRRRCAAAGCGGRGPFRVVLYNGYPGHGDPAHSSSPHLHLSWQHAPAAPFTRAAWVRTLLPQTVRPRPLAVAGPSDDTRRPGAGGGCGA